MNRLIYRKDKYIDGSLPISKILFKAAFTVTAFDFGGLGIKLEVGECFDDPDILLNRRAFIFYIITIL
jgi:hypothetical protein